MNIIQIQERLKDVSDNDLVQQMQAPTGAAPQYLILSELQRRKRMRDEYQRQQAANMPTVAEEAVAAAGVPQGGIMQMAGAMAPRSAIAQDTGVNDMAPTPATRAPQEPIRMQAGGMVGDPLAPYAQYLDQTYSNPTIESFVDKVRGLENETFGGINSGFGSPTQFGGMNRSLNPMAPTTPLEQLGASTLAVQPLTPTPPQVPPAQQARRVPSQGVIASDSALNSFNLRTANPNYMTTVPAGFGNPLQQRLAARGMAEGGIVKMQAGGPVVRAGTGIDMYDYMNDPAIRALANRQGMTVEQYISSLSPEMRRIVLGTTPRATPSPMTAPRTAEDAIRMPTMGSGDLGINRVMPPVDFDATAPAAPSAAGMPLRAVTTPRLGNIRPPVEDVPPDLIPMPRGLTRAVYGAGGIGVPGQADMTPAMMPGAAMRPETGGIASIPPIASDVAPRRVPTAAEIDDMRAARTRAYDEYDPYAPPPVADVLRQSLTPDVGVRQTMEQVNEQAGEYAGLGEAPKPGEGIMLGDIGESIIQGLGFGPAMELARRRGMADDAEEVIEPEMIEEPEAPPVADRLTLPGTEAAEDEVMRPEGAPELSFGDLVVGAPAETATTAVERAAGVGGRAGGAGDVAGMSDLESLMARRERRAQQDKWLALAQFGMQLMSSTQPTLGGAIGEAGMSALTGLREAEADYEEDMLDYLAMQQRQQALARGVGGAAAEGLPPAAKMSDVKSGIELIDSIIARDFTTTDPITGAVTVDTTNPEYIRLLAEREALMDQYLGRLRPTISAANLPPVSGGGIADLSMGTPVQ